MKRNARGFVLFCFLLLLLALPMRALGEEGRSIDLCYVNGEENELLLLPLSVPTGSPEDMLQVLMGSLNNREKGEGGQPLFPAGVRIASYSLAEDSLAVDFSEEYLALDPARAFLLRAGVARTLLQVPGLAYLSFLAGGEEVKDQSGEPLGKISWGDFLDLSPSTPEAPRFDTLTLYFTDKKGKKLFSEVRKVYCRRDIPREYVVIEQLAKGPMREGHYPTISENVTVNDCVITGRIARLDLSRAFLDYPQDISSQLVVASVVNSLIAVGNIDEVQISIAGDEHAVMPGDLDLYQYFQWNEKIVKE